MGYRSDSIAISPDMGPLSAHQRTGGMDLGYFFFKVSSYTRPLGQKGRRLAFTNVVAQALYPPPPSSRYRVQP